MLQPRAAPRLLVQCPGMLSGRAGLVATFAESPWGAESQGAAVGRAQARLGEPFPEMGLGPPCPATACPGSCRGLETHENYIFIRNSLFMVLRTENKETKGKWHLKAFYSAFCLKP